MGREAWRLRGATVLTAFRETWEFTKFATVINAFVRRETGNVRVTISDFPSRLTLTPHVLTPHVSRLTRLPPPVSRLTSSLSHASRLTSHASRTRLIASTLTSPSHAPHASRSRLTSPPHGPQSPSRLPRYRQNPYLIHALSKNIVTSAFWSRVLIVFPQLYYKMQAGMTPRVLLCQVPARVSVTRINVFFVAHSNHYQPPPPPGWKFCKNYWSHMPCFIMPDSSMLKWKRTWRGIFNLLMPPGNAAINLWILHLVPVKAQTMLIEQGMSFFIARSLIIPVNNTDKLQGYSFR